MATHLKFVFATCLLLLIAMEEFKPILAKKGEPLKQRTKILEKSVAELKDKIKVLEECQCKYTDPNWSCVSAEINSLNNISLLRAV